jgi:toxin-antitoxin system PIN domain toxin
MILLADVNVLLALVWSHHTHHAKARAWWAELQTGDVLATCAITELGFVRVSLQDAFVATDIAVAKRALSQLRAARPGHVFLDCRLGATALPEWVKTPRQTTDGYIVALAAAHGGRLVTLDAGIPGAKLIR